MFLARMFPGLRGLEPWLAALAGGVVFLIACLIRGPGRRPDRQPARCHPPASALAPGSSPALSIVSLQGVRKAANFRDPRFFRYDAGAEAAPDPAHPPAAYTGRPGAQPPALLGNWALVSVFAGCDGRSWSESEIAGRLDGLIQAAQWLAGEAARYGAAVRLGVCDTYLAIDDDSVEPVEIGFAPQGNEIAPFEGDQEARALVLISRGARQMGFRDAAELVAQVESRLSGWRSVWLLHVRRAGGSLAIPADLADLPGVSLAVCYAREASFTEPVVRVPAADPVTFVHEVLHLFGATDKYGSKLDAFAPGSVTASEIMRLDRDRLDQLRIDALTAEEIGWCARPGNAERDRTVGDGPPG